MPKKRRVSETNVAAKQRPVDAITSLSLKNTLDLFVGNVHQKTYYDEETQKTKIRVKVGFMIPSDGLGLLSI